MKRRSFIAAVAAGAAALAARIKPPKDTVYVIAIDPPGDEDRDFWVQRLVIMNPDGRIVIVPYKSRLDPRLPLSLKHASTA